jgi:hypothetical protein
VTPLRPQDPGRPRELLYVVYEISAQVPGLARVVDLTPVRANAVARVLELEDARRDRPEVRGPREQAERGPGRGPHLEPGLGP